MIEPRPGPDWPGLGKYSETGDIAHMTSMNTQRCAPWSPGGVAVGLRVASLSQGVKSTCVWRPALAQIRKHLV